jgi:hypothetical protein
MVEHPGTQIHGTEETPSFARVDAAVRHRTMGYGHDLAEPPPQKPLTAKATETFDAVFHGIYFIALAIGDVPFLSDEPLVDFVVFPSLRFELGSKREFPKFLCSDAPSRKLVGFVGFQSQPREWRCLQGTHFPPHDELERIQV